MSNAKAPLSSAASTIIQFYDWWCGTERESFGLGTPREYVHSLSDHDLHPGGFSQQEAIAVAQEVQLALGQWRRVRLSAELDLYFDERKITLAIDVIKDAR